IPLNAFSLSLQKGITGTVIDEIGAPLSGATVLEKGTINEAKTDHDGNFAIQVSPNAVLQISFIGYETKEVPVNGKSKIAIQLDPGSTQLEDVVVVGYGTQRRSDITGSIASVKSEDF